MTEESQRPAPSSPESRKRLPRFHIFHLMLLPVLLVVILLVLDWKSLLPTSTWSGEQAMALDFEVVDGVSARPLEGVLLEVADASGKPRVSGCTDPEGRATLVGKFSAAGTHGLFGKKHDAKILPFVYRLSRPGYDSVQSLGTTGYYLGSTPPHPRFRWGLTLIDAQSSATGPR